MGHWYDKDGNPQHFTNGRASTLKDARKNNWFPSVTEIINTLDKPALTNWKIRQAVEAAQELPYQENEGSGSYYARITKQAFSDSTEARDKGSEIHKAIETWWKRDGITARAGIWLIACAAGDAIEEYCGKIKFRSEQTVVGNGYGGMIDLNNDKFCIDYKTKDIKDEDWDKYQIWLNSSSTKYKPPKLAYPEHCMQLSAYDKALGGEPRRLVNVFIDRNIEGRVIIHEWDENMFDRFELLVKYWQLSKNYFPAGFEGKKE